VYVQYNDSLPLINLKFDIYDAMVLSTAPVCHVLVDFHMYADTSVQNWFLVFWFLL